jgi:acetylornithine/N-succinyldiaminopimelate aminotransferase
VVVRELAEGKLLDNVVRMGNLLKQELSRMKETFPSKIKEVRGRGLMLGVDLFDEAKVVVDGLRERKVLVNSTDRTVLRIVPALNIQEQHIAEFVEALEKVLSGR